MKYTNGSIRYNGKQRAAFACAKTFKKCLELLKEIDDGMNQSYFNNYWANCGNDVMKNIAKDKEGVWIASSSHHRDYKLFVNVGEGE